MKTKDFSEVDIAKIVDNAIELTSMVDDALAFTVSQLAKIASELLSTTISTTQIQYYKDRGLLQPMIYGIDSVGRSRYLYSKNDLIRVLIALIVRDRYRLSISEIVAIVLTQSDRLPLRIATPKAPQVFICHSSHDKPLVVKLCRDLEAAGVRPWLDEKDLLPGQDWDLEIRRAIRKSDFFLACLSRNSIDKRGYVQKEIKIGLDVLDEMPEGRVYLIPVRLEPCVVPERLKARQWVDLFVPGGFDKLIKAMKNFD